MNWHVDLRPEAISDIESSRDRYEVAQVGLGASFARHVSEAIDRIAMKPELFASLTGGVRFYRVKRFPYIVYYRILLESVEVLAVLHGSRDQSVWRSRVL